MNSSLSLNVSLGRLCFDNNFAPISNEFLDVSQFGNFGVTNYAQTFRVHLICLQNIFAISLALEVGNIFVQIPPSPGRKAGQMPHPRENYQITVWLAEQNARLFFAFVRLKYAKNYACSAG